MIFFDNSAIFFNQLYNLCTSIFIRGQKKKAKKNRNTKASTEKASKKNDPETQDNA